MTILTFVFDQSWCLGWPARSLSRNKANICCCFFFNPKNVLNINPKLYLLIFIFSSNKNSPYFQAQLHPLSLFLGSLLPQVENNCILVGIFCYVPVFQCKTLWMDSIDPGFFDSLESSVLCSVYICSFFSYESAKQRLNQSPPGAPVTTTVSYHYHDF